MSEKEKTSAEASAPAPAEEKKKGGKKLIIIIAIFILLVGAGGGGFFYWRSTSVAAAEETNKKKGDKKAHADNESEDSDGETAKEETHKGKGGVPGDPLKNSLPNDEDVKQIVELPPFIVNLADTEQARYLRMSVSLGIDGAEEESEKPNPLFITRVRNTMLAVLSDKKSDEILSVEGKTKLRKELLEAAQAASEEPKVQAIYITDFIIQL